MTEVPLHELLDRWLENNEIFGWALVTNDGEEVCRGADAAGAKLSLAGRFPYASTTKAFTGYAIARSGLDLQADVRGWIPGFPRHTTPAQAITHQAGIPATDLEAEGGLPPLDDDATWDRYLEAVCRAPLLWEPGTLALYHGLTGPFLAAACLHPATGVHYRDHLRSLLDELDLTSVGFAQEGMVAPSTGADLAQFRGQPGGGLVGTLHDCLRLFVALLDPDDEAARVTRTDHSPGVPEGDDVVASWGLGLRLASGSPAPWFGIGPWCSPEAFGHAGIHTILGFAEPSTGRAGVCYVPSDLEGANVERWRCAFTRHLAR